MRQSHSYRRKNAGRDIDPNDYNTYRNGVAFRIIRRNRGRLTPHDAWQLAAIPAFFLWLFRRPISFFKKRKADRIIKRKLAKTNINHSSNQ